MSREEALALVLAIACRWGENVEEGFPKRISADTTDEECRQMAQAEFCDLEEITEVRDVWRAVALLSPEQVS